jgi:Gram-negative bacterial TonB protein C-terminal
MPTEKAVMSQSVTHDGQTLQSRLADYYRWIEPDRGTCIYINFEAADRLQRQVLRGLDSGGGLELGGILLGTTTSEGERITAIIDDFEAVPCTYSNGPHYRADEPRFSAVRSRFKAADSGPSIVGYYRSHIRNDLYLSTEDLTLIQSVFPESNHVFLLIKPLPMRACTAGFFFREDGRIQSEFTLEVPFAPLRPLSAALPEVDSIDDLMLAARTNQSVELTTVPQEQSQEPIAARRKRWYEGGRGPAVVALGIALSLGIWIFAYWQAGSPTVSGPPPVPQNLPSEVEPAPVPALTPSVRAETGVPASPRRPPVISSPVPAAPKPVPQQAVNPPAAFRPASPTAADVKPPGETKPAETKPAETKTAESIPPPLAINPKPEVTRSAPPESAPRQTEPASPLPSAPPTPAAPVALPPAPATTFVGPQVIYRVSPAVPLDVRALITDETQIDVTVTIDSGGKAIDAQVTSSRGAAARLVAPEAIKAAKLFRFQPARENERAVQSKMVLTFRFKRPGS